MAKGRQALDIDDYPGAITAFSQALELDRADTEALCCRSGACLAQEDFARAVVDAAECVHLAPRGANGYLVWAAALFGLGWYGDATTALEKGEEEVIEVPALRVTGHLAMSAEKVSRSYLLLPPLKPLRSQPSPLAAMGLPCASEAEVHCGVEKARAARDKARRIASSLSTQADAREAEGKHDRALALREEALTYLRKGYAADSLVLDEALTGLVHLYRRLSKQKRILALVEEELARVRLMLPRHDPHVGRLLSAGANAYEGIGNWVKASLCLEEAVNVYRGLLPEQTEELGLALYSLALLMNRRGHEKRAISLLEEALAMNRLAFPDGNMAVYNTLRKLAECLMWSNPQRSEALLQEALAWLRQVGSAVGRGVRRGRGRGLRIQEAGHRLQQPCDPNLNPNPQPQPQPQL